MRELYLNLNHDNFSLFWLSLLARENELLKLVVEYGEDSDEGSFALNDLVYLRLYREDLKEKAEKVFDQSVFSTSNEPY